MSQRDQSDSLQTDKKQVKWKISERLRYRLNSHAEYLSVENQILTEDMVAKWLEERLTVEERERALRTLGIKESDLPKPRK